MAPKVTLLLEILFLHSVSISTTSCLGSWEVCWKPSWLWLIKRQGTPWNTSSWQIHTETENTLTFLPKDRLESSVRPTFKFGMKVLDCGKKTDEACTWMSRETWVENWAVLLFAMICILATFWEFESGIPLLHQMY